MSSLLNLKTRTKLFIAFGMMVALLAGVSAISYRDTTALKEAQQALFHEDLSLAVDLLRLRNTLNRERVVLLSMAVGEAGAQSHWLQELEKEGRELAAIVARLQRSKVGADDSAALGPVVAAQQAYAAVRDNGVVPALKAGRRAEASAAIVGPLQLRFTALREVADAAGEQQLAQANNRMQQSARMVETALTTLVIANLVALIIGVTLVLLLDRVIAGPLRRAMEVARQVAAGNLTVTIPRTKGEDEVGQLLESLDAMVRAWTTIMKETGTGIAALSAAASEILATAMQGSASATETAAAVAETGATVEEVKQTAVLASQKAKTVADAAQQAAHTAESGRAAIEGGVEGMDLIQEQMEAIGTTIVRLSERSQAIAEIIATVGGLAEQSNLLAVNAAIEAAKAGELGRGFSVVAQEVRGLADQSRQATRQVRQILSEIEKAVGTAVMIAEQSTKTVARGVEQSNRAGHAIKSLADSIGDAAQAAAQIAASSQQQLAGMDQVALAMENIKQASADNAAGSRQSEGAAHDLHDLGQQLKRMSERFQFE
jgi:methyl-accepting chemotaxis protein